MRIYHIVNVSIPHILERWMQDHHRHLCAARRLASQMGPIPFLALLLGLMMSGCDGAAPMAAEPQVADIAAAVRAADPVRGAALYAERCGGCHQIDGNRAGPAHRGLIGRRAGSAPDYQYSDALAAAGFTWDDRHLDAWLIDPEALVPGQKMNVQVAKARDRADLIAYLHTVSP
jgi:cytochrome c